jgi:hypothetical protein
MNMRQCLAQCVGLHFLLHVSPCCLVGRFPRNADTYLFTKLDGVASHKSVIFVSSP